MKLFTKKIFWILFWAFWIVLGLSLITLALNLYVQMHNPAPIDVSNVKGIIPKIIVITLGFTVMTAVLASVFILALILIGVYFLITWIILLIKLIFKKRKKRK